MARTKASGDEKSETQERILRAAASEFADKGYKGASIRMISSLAKVNVAAVNYYFGSKENLYFETYRYVIDMPGGNMERVLELKEWQDFDTWLVEARNFFSLVMHRSFQRDKRAMLRRKMFAMELAHPSDCMGLVLERYHQPLYNHVRGLLSQVLVDVDEDTLLTWTQFVLNQLLTSSMMVPPWDSLLMFHGRTPEEWIERSLDFLMEMIVSRLKALPCNSRVQVQENQKE